MKGTILVCLRDMLVHDFDMSAEQWRALLEKSGFDRNTVILPSTDVSDELALAAFGEAQNRYFSSHIAMADAFGHYWSVIYAPSVYASVYQRVSNARDFILNMDRVHIQVTQSIPNATPPRFAYTTVSAEKLLVDYQSERGLVHLFAGLCRGIGHYYGENLNVEVLNGQQVSIEFLPG